MGVAGKFTQLGALASYTVPSIQKDLLLLAHNLAVQKGARQSPKSRRQFKKLKEVIAEMDKAEPLPARNGTEAGTGMRRSNERLRVQAQAEVRPQHGAIRSSRAANQNGKRINPFKSGFETKNRSSVALRDAVVDYEKTHGKITKHRGILGTVSGATSWATRPRPASATGTRPSPRFAVAVERRAAAEQAPAGG